MDTIVQAISQMNRYELDDLERMVIQPRRLELAAMEIKALGLGATSMIHGEPWEYVLVYSPNLMEIRNQWADLAECRRLVDTLVNLPPAEAFRRWAEKVVEKYPSKPYTRSDAFRDTREARAQLRADLDSGRIDAEGYSILYPSTSFFDLVE